MNTIYNLFSIINLVAAVLCVYYAKKLYDSTKGAADFWLFLSAFIFSLGAYIFFDFVEKLFGLVFESAIKAAQDMSISFAAIFALVSAIYIKKMFDEMTGE
ncbi:MAG: hypothetical protein OIN87_08765 [Candidatus Methanoperedens sp.]|nr:hypothetical protein [Candidatus Methanoperedens sp.]